jgi:hypothetical protein
MASFTDLVAQRIYERREEFMSSLSNEPNDEIESLLAAGVQTHWHPLELEDKEKRERQDAAAIDGSHAIRALNIGADWIVAQALLIGPHGLRLLAADTLLLRGDIERPAVDRCASLLMRSLELDLALKFVEGSFGTVLLMDGSLYSDLPYLLYNLAIGGYEDLPLRVLEKYLELFELCQKREVLLLGIAKRTRATVLGRTLLDHHLSTAPSVSRLADTPQSLPADVQDEIILGDATGQHQQRRKFRPDTYRFPSDGELLRRWTHGPGFTDPVLLGSASFGHTSSQVVAQLSLQVKESLQVSDTLPVQDRLRPIQQRLLAAPAIGTFYLRVAQGDDVLRVDALAGTFGRVDLRLLDFAQILVPYTSALAIVRLLKGDYGGLAVYNAALYVVDQEVRLHTETVDHVYLPVLRRQLGYPVLYDRATRRFFR